MYDIVNIEIAGNACLASVYTRQHGPFILSSNARHSVWFSSSKAACSENAGEGNSSTLYRSILQLIFCIFISTYIYTTIFNKVLCIHHFELEKNNANADKN